MIARVQLAGRTIAPSRQLKVGTVAAFQYDPEFATSGIELSPLTLPLSERVYVFPRLARRTFHDLLGMLADSLPDRFGNALIDAWLARAGTYATRPSLSSNAVAIRCTRGMGALEYLPSLRASTEKAPKIEISALGRSRVRSPDRTQGVEEPLRPDASERAP